MCWCIPVCVFVWVWTVKEKCSYIALHSLPTTSLFPPFSPALIKDSPVFGLQSPQTSLWNYWSLKSTWRVRRQTDSAMDGWDAVITESMQLVEKVLTFQSCTLLSKELWSHIAVRLVRGIWHTHRASRTHGVLNITPHLYKNMYASYVCAANRREKKKGFPHLTLCFVSDHLQG